MKYRKLGRSGLRVSVVGLGSWLTYGGRVGEKVAHACLTRAREMGVNFFDTANVYAHGAAEETTGRWLKAVPRSEVVVATKVYFRMGDAPNERGLSRKHIMEQCHASLERLGLDYVDLYQCHRYDPSVPIDETLRALDDLTAQGKVLYAGVSEWNEAQIVDGVRTQERLGLRRLVSNQPQYSLLARRIESKVLPRSIEEGIGQVVWSPLAGGVLTGKYSPGEEIPADSRAANPETAGFVRKVLDEGVLSAVQRLREAVARPLGVTVAQLAIAWTLAHEGVSAAIVGATRVEHVEENVAAADLELDAETMERIEAIMGPYGLKMQS